MKRLYIFFLLLCCVVQMLAQSKGTVPVVYKLPAGTERRLALVIGNKNYPVGPLKNPHNDADDMARVLQNLGFDVILKKDLNWLDFLKAIDDFGEKLGRYDVGLLYYSGHGIQYHGENYLVPIDSKINVAQDIEYTCVNLGRAMAKMEGAKLKTSLIFLDACRTSPFRSINRGGVEQGFTIPNNPPGSFVVFSTRAGSTADDNGGGRNGLFTTALLRNLPQANVGLRTMMDNTIIEVSKTSNKAQIPGRYDELTGDFYFLVSDSKQGFLPFEPEMIFVQGGSFDMGSNDGYSIEKPVHRVTLGDYYIGKYEVTQAQWEAVIGDNPSRFKGCANCPVENVSWNDIQTYLNKLNKKTNKTYRLPTEAEWEYAARGGKNSEGYVYAGSASAESVGWNYSNSDMKTHEVGGLKANELGLYDMSGNVWEWCSDWYRAYSSSASSNPTGPSSGTDRILRGGGWDGDAQYSRVALRSGNTPEFRYGDNGFRVVLVP